MHCGLHKILRVIFCLLIGLFLITHASIAQSATGYSPSKNITVALFMTEHNLAQGKDHVDDLNHVKYDVVFSDQQGKELARSTYADVYGWDSLAVPANPEKIISLFEWSPEEDFVILPPEDWSGYMGPFPIAINLRADKQWEKKEIVALDGWISPTKFYAGWILDCDASVALFDAVTGKETEIRMDEGLFGYVIVEDDGAGHVVIKREPNNCANDEQREQFVPTCERWDLNLLSFEAVECPG